MAETCLKDGEEPLRSRGAGGNDISEIVRQQDNNNEPQMYTNVQTQDEENGRCIAAMY